MTEDERYLDAARKIRDDPGLPETLAPKLDSLLATAAKAEGDARMEAIDELVVTLRNDAWAHERLAELTPDVERGMPDWPDGVLPGEDADRSNLLEFTCAACGYVNKLAYQPPEDDMPLCRNPDGDSHDLVLG